ncbi:MAG: hypothetical protein V4663_16320 [Bacteroidota bacterium]
MENYFIHETAIIGIGFRFLQGCVESEDSSKYGLPILPKKLYVGPFAMLGFNCKIGEGVIIDSYCKVDPGAEIGENTLITYRASIGSGAIIGADCIIGGTVSEETRVGNRCRIFGKLIHKHTDSTMSWDFHDIPEPGATIHDDSFVAHDATIMGGLEIGPRSYVCAGAIITKDVPPYHIGYGINKIVHFSEWKGELSMNPLFHP